MKKTNLKIYHLTLYFFLLISWNTSLCQTNTSLERTALLLKNAITEYEQLKQTNNTDSIAIGALNIADIYAQAGLSTEALKYYHIGLSVLENKLEKPEQVNNIKQKIIAALWSENQLDSVVFYKNENEPW